MTDWGIPDWLEQNAYGDTKRWSEHRWRWEFTRRRADCRNDFETYKDKTVRHLEDVRAREVEQSPDAKRGRLLRPDEPGFVAQFIPGCYEKYGLRSLPNPAIGDQPFHVIMFEKRDWGVLSVPEEEENSGDPDRDDQQPLLERRFLKTTQAVLILDLTAPLRDQWKAARQLLEWKQKSTVGQLVRPGKKHPTKWLCYLRVLDAKESGASLSKIAKSGVLNGRQDDPQCARDVLEAAKALCFKWPA